MSLETVSNPELGKIYLVRRHRGGPVAARYQPARILERELKTSTAFTHYQTKVIWLFDNKVEVIDEFDGFVKELSAKWLRDESKRRDAEAATAVQAANVVKVLLAQVDSDRR